MKKYEKTFKHYQNISPQNINNIRHLTDKGLYETLLVIKENQPIRHSTLAKYITKNNISSESYFSRNLAYLNEMNLVKRKIIDEKPAGTSYCITKKGCKAIRKIDDLASLLFSE